MPAPVAVHATIKHIDREKFYLPATLRGRVRFEKTDNGIKIVERESEQKN